MSAAIVIAGTGHAGFQLAASLRQEGHRGTIHLIGDEAGLPYQRPPLSKAYLLGKTDADGLRFRPQKFFDDHAITLVQGRVAAIDRTNRTVAVDEGSTFGYEHLVLALGAHNRRLPVPGSDLDGVFGLRTQADADQLAARLQSARDVIVCGAGFIGLEFAAVASAKGCSVHVLELEGRAMARAVSIETSLCFREAHEAQGVIFDFGQGLAHIESVTGQGVTHVVTTGGLRLPADLVIVGIGVLPNTLLAAEAGLEIDDGIKVDNGLLTSDPSISAIGDCASFHSVHAGRRLRIESVQNASDQARCVAQRLSGKAPGAYGALPWFWSDQGAMRLQIAGLAQGADATVTVGDRQAQRFSVLRFRHDRLIAVESVNMAADHMAARKLLMGRTALTPREASAAGFDLRAFEVASRA
ncbi:3-phenylpropionate/trans-cinnamate dioxygenase ferredoxin reductase subunit [Variovorax sp. OAS795]|uniref:NAD(P)/FAD-dependent oxidoreductase n=1 Tax=Variovorax sp. OAS795 TaxID=3034231 RepID=UPI00339B1646